MAKTQLSMTAQVGLVLGVALLFSIILTVVGFLATDEIRQKMTAFASDGVMVAGTITDKRIVRTTKSGIWVHWLDLTFKTEDGSTRNQSTQVANTIYDGYRVGGPVQVTYVRSKPDWFYVPGGEPTERDAGIMSEMHKYGAMAAVLSALGLVVLFFKSRGGTPGGGLQQSTTLSARRMPSQSRTSFGTRRFDT
jgi:hypothetical protein